MSFNFYVVNGLVIRNNSLGKYEVKDLNTNTWKQSNDPYIGRMVSNDGTQVNLDTAEEFFRNTKMRQSQPSYQPRVIMPYQPKVVALSLFRRFFLK